MSRKKGWVLGGLLLIWAGLLALRVGTYEEPARVPLTHRSGQALLKTESRPVAGRTTLATAPAFRENPLTLHPPNNIFAPLSRRIEVTAQVSDSGGEAMTPSTGEIKNGTPPSLSPTDVAIAHARAQRERDAAEARQRMAQYRFIGYLSQNGEPRAFLGKGTDLYIVRAGETLEGQIRVASIGTTLLKLRDGVSHTERALPLTLSMSGLQPPGELNPAGESALAGTAEHP